MATEGGVDLGSVYTSIRLQLQELHSGIAQAKQQVRDMDRELQRATQNVERNFDAMGRTVYNVLAAAFSVAAVRQFSRALDDLARQAFESQSNLLVLANQLARTGQDAGTATRLIRELSAELRVPQEELAGAAAELLRYGYSIEQIVQVFRGAAASALLMGRSTADGVRLVADALISERSTVLNTIGITENLSVAYQQYARQLGTTVDRLTAHQKAEAATQMIVKATAAEVADLETLFRGYGGAVAEAEMESYRLRQTLGQALLPSIADARAEMADLYQVLAQIAQTPEVREILEGIGEAMAASVREIREAVEWLGRHRDLLNELADIAVPGMATVLAVSLLPRLQQLYTILRDIGRLPATRAGLIIAGLFAILKVVEALDQRLQQGMSASEALADVWQSLLAMLKGEELPAPEEPGLPEPSASVVPEIQQAETAIRSLSDAMDEYRDRIVLARAGFGDLTLALLEYGDYLRQILLDESQALGDRANAATELRDVLEELAEVAPSSLARYADVQGILDQVLEGQRRAVQQMLYERLELTQGALIREEQELWDWYETQKRLYVSNQEALLALDELYAAKRADLNARIRDEIINDLRASIEEEARLYGWSNAQLLQALQQAAKSLQESNLEQLYGPLSSSEAFRELRIRIAELNRQVEAEQARELERQRLLEQQALERRLQAEQQITEDINRVRMSETEFYLWQLEQQAEAFRELGVEEARIAEWVAMKRLEYFQEYYRRMRTELDELIDALRGAGQTELAGALAELQQQVQSGDLFLGRLAQAQIDEATRVFWEALVETGDVALAAAEALDALRDVTEEVTAWEQMRAGIQEAILGQLGATGQLITGLTTGNWQQAGAAGVQMLLEESEALADAFEALTEGIAALLAPVDALIGLVESVGGKPASGAAVGAGVGWLIGGPIGAIAGGILGLIGGSRRQAEEERRRAEEERRRAEQEWREWLRRADYGELVAREQVLQRQFELWQRMPIVGRAMADQFAERLEEVRETIRQVLNVTADDLRGAVRRAFSAETAEDLSTAIYDSLKDKVRDAIVTAWLESTTMRPIWDALSDAIVGAVQDGVLTAAEMTTLERIMAEIEGKAAPFYQALQELGLVGGGEEADGRAAGGLRLVDFTGQTRNMFAEMLRPISTLDRLPFYQDLTLQELRRQTGYLAAIAGASGIGEQAAQIARSEELILQTGQVVMQYVNVVYFTGQIGQINVSGGQAAQTLEVQLAALESRGALQSRAAGA